MKYNKLIVSGCSFVADIHDLEDIKRNIQPEYVKNFIRKYPNKNAAELRKLPEYINLLQNYIEYKWTTLLKNYLDVPLVDFADGGNSNPRIFRDITNYLIENKNDTNNLVIIGTTALNRINRWLDYKQEYINLHLKNFDKFEKIENLYSSHLFDNPNDLADYQMLYLKYFHDEEESLRQVQENIDLLKYICKQQNHRLFIFDNLIFSTSRNKRILGRTEDPLKERFMKDNHENLLYFEDDIFCFPKFIKLYDNKYVNSHPNRVDHKIFFDIIKDKI